MVPALVSNKAWVRHPSPPSHTYVHSAICKKQIRIHMHIACPHLSLVRTCQCHLLVRTWHTYVHSAICKKQIRIHMHIACPHLSLVRTCHLLVRTCHLSAPVTCPHLSLESAPVTYVRTCQCHQTDCDLSPRRRCSLSECAYIWKVAPARFRKMLVFGR